MKTTDFIQFGTSRFLQAHADLFFSEASPARTVTVVQSSGDSARSARLAALARPEGFTVKIQGVQDGKTIEEERRVTSVKRTLSTDSDWQEVCQVAATSEFILSNTSEKGFAPTSSDFDKAPVQGMSYPAKLTHILASRYAGGHKPPTLLPTELLTGNGDLLKARVVEIARTVTFADGFVDWLQAMPAANSIVDRIVSEPIEPAGAIAEPYALWAIESAPGVECPCNHPAVIMVPDLEQYARLKLHILNLGHTFLADDWLKTGGPKDATVLDAMNSGKRDELLAIWLQEVVPGFAGHGMEAIAKEYVNQTIERFSNPFLAHRISDIAQGHGQKVQQRINDFLHWCGADALQQAPTLARIVKENNL